MNGAVKTVGSIDGGAVNGLLQQPTNDRGWIGEVYAVVENTNKDKAKTNAITVTDVEQPVEVSDFSIINDYDTPVLAYAAADDAAVMTVTMSKAVDGALYIYKESTTKFGNGNNFAKITADDFATTKTVEKASQLTAKKALEEAAKTYLGENCTGINFQNADGSTTYMLSVDDLGMDNPFAPVRGTTYKAVFDQEAISTDDIGATTRSDVTVSDPFAAPYVTAPESIALTGHSAGSAPQITFYDAEGEVITWLGRDSDTIDDCGIANVTTYGETGSTKAKAKKDTQPQTSDLTKGVITGGTALRTDYSYFWATVTTAKGIFGAKAVTLESAIVEGTEKPYATMNLVDDSTNPKDAVITLTKLKTPGTVYVLQSSTSRAIKSGDFYGVESFDADDVATYVGKADVEKGDTKVTISNALSSYTDALADGGNWYTAYFVPANTDDFSIAYPTTYANTKQSVKDASVDNNLKLAQIPKSIAYDEDGTAETEEIKNEALDKEKNISDIFEGGKIKAYDQFGDLMLTDEDPKTVSCVAVNNTLINTEDANAQFEIYTDPDDSENTGLVRINLYRNDVVDPGDGFDLTILGSKVSLRNKSGDLINNTAATTGWEVKLGSNTVISGPDSALGTAKITFPEFETDVDTTAAAGFASYTGALADGANIILETSTNGTTWNNSGATVTAAAGKITTGTDVDIKANTYYRFKITKAGLATATKAMESAKTAAAAPAISANAVFTLTATTYTADTNVTITTDGGWDPSAPTIKDQFGDNFGGTATFKSTTVAGEDDDTVTLTATVAAGVISKIKLDGSLATTQAAVFSDNTHTITVKPTNALAALTAADVQAAAIVETESGKIFSDEVAKIKAAVLNKIQTEDAAALGGITEANLAFSNWTFGGTAVEEGTGTALTTTATPAAYRVTITYGGETKVITGCSTDLSDGDD